MTHPIEWLDKTLQPPSHWPQEWIERYAALPSDEARRMVLAIDKAPRAPIQQAFRMLALNRTQDPTTFARYAPSTLQQLQVLHEQAFIIRERLRLRAELSKADAKYKNFRQHWPAVAALLQDRPHLSANKAFMLVLTRGKKKRTCAPWKRDLRQLRSNQK